MLPFLSSAVFGVPMIIPMGTAMAFELATYGIIVGFLYNNSRWQCIVALYRSLLIAMVAGRIVWGAVMAIIIIGIQGGTFTLTAFMTAAFVGGIPGIVIQLILIPIIMFALKRTGLLPVRKYHAHTTKEDA
jgi:hypothetical protein